MRQSGAYLGFLKRVSTSEHGTAGHGTHDVVCVYECQRVAAVSPTCHTVAGDVSKGSKRLPRARLLYLTPSRVAIAVATRNISHGLNTD